MSYSEIIERLENATGPDRSLDVLVYVACGFGSIMEQHGNHYNPLRADGRRQLHSFIGEEKGPYQPNEAEDVSGMVGWDVFTVPPFTASLDAAIALVERMLPGCEITMTDTHGDFLSEHEPRHSADIMRGLIWSSHDGFPQPDYETQADASSATRPLALIIAMFRALEAEAKP